MGGAKIAGRHPPNCGNQNPLAFQQVWTRNCQNIDVRSNRFAVHQKHRNLVQGGVRRDCVPTHTHPLFAPQGQQNDTIWSYGNVIIFLTLAAWRQGMASGRRYDANIVRPEVASLATVRFNAQDERFVAPALSAVRIFSSTLIPVNTLSLTRCPLIVCRCGGQRHDASTRCSAVFVIQVGMGQCPDTWSFKRKLRGFPSCGGCSVSSQGR